MKKIILSFTLLLFLLKVFSQSPDSTYSKAYYLQKSKTDKTIARVLMGVGGITSSIIFLSAISGLDNYPYHSKNNGQAGYVIATVVSLGASLASIPFHISSRKNARKAATISLKNQEILFPLENSLVKSQPAFTLKIAL